MKPPKRKPGPAFRDWPTGRRQRIPLRWVEVQRILTTEPSGTLEARAKMLCLVMLDGLEVSDCIPLHLSDLYFDLRLMVSDNESWAMSAATAAFFPFWLDVRPQYGSEQAVFTTAYGRPMKYEPVITAVDLWGRVALGRVLGPAELYYTYKFNLLLRGAPPGTNSESIFQNAIRPYARLPEYSYKPW